MLGKHLVKTLGLALAAVLALSAVSVASASALPEFVPSTKQTFTSVSGAGELVSGGSTIKCTADTNTGEITGANTVGKVVVKFTKCTVKILFTFPCKTKNAPNAEEIITKPLVGTLGYINKAEKTVGLKLKPEAGEEYTEGEIECAGQNIRVKGAVIGKVTPVNTSSTTGTLTFTNSGTKQVPEEIEISGTVETGIHLVSSLNGGTFEASAEKTTDEITFTNAVEVKA